MTLAVLLLISSIIFLIVSIPKLDFRDLKPLPAILVLVAVMTFFLSLAKIRSENQEQEYASNVGRLEPTPTNGITYPSIALGNSKLTFLGGTEEFFSSPALHGAFDGIKLKVWVENDQLYLSTIIRDPSRKDIAVITANEWEMNPNNYFRKNFDKHSFEITDMEGHVYLQAQLKDSATVKLNALFYKDTPTYFHSVVGDSIYGCEFFEYPDGSGGFKALYNYDPVILPVQPIFKYPTMLHKGEKEGEKKYELP